MATTNARWAAGVGQRATVRGFRSTFSDWSTEEGNAPMLVEVALADVVQGVEGAYRRTDCWTSEGRWASHVSRGCRTRDNQDYRGRESRRMGRWPNR